MSMQPYVGFRPDVDTTTPGVITDCDDLLPTAKGFKAMPSNVPTLLPALAAACKGAAVVSKLDGTNRFFAGTGTALYEASTSSWTDRSKVGGYTTGDIVWRFTQFGNSTIATNKNDTMQVSTSGAFADITGAPKASVMDAAAGFVMLGATNDGTYGDSPDRWWCCSFQDATSGTAWTPDVTTQCTTGRLIEAPGSITAMKALGKNFVAYKEKSMFLGEYVGAPNVFTWNQIPGEIGAFSQESVVSVGTAHFFIGANDIWMFDGTRPVAIGGDLKEWFFNQSLNKPYRANIRGMHERSANRVWFFYPSGTSSSNDRAIVYNYLTQKWGKCSITIEFPVEYISGSITWSDMGTYYSTWEDLPLIAYDSPFWTSTTQLPAIFDTAHTLQTITGASSGCSITLGDLGDDTQLSMLSRSRPRFSVSPTSGTMTNYYRDNLGDAVTLDVTSTLTGGKFDVLRTARWHRLKYDYVGDVEVIGDAISLVQDGFA